MKTQLEESPSKALNDDSAQKPDPEESPLKLHKEEAKPVVNVSQPVEKTAHTEVSHTEAKPETTHEETKVHHAEAPIAETTKAPLVAPAQHEK